MRKVGGFFIKIEVECWSIEEVREVVIVGVDIVMLDNFEFKVFYKVVEVLKKEFLYFLIEGSGGVKMEIIV